jgi:hypothetical protein
LGPAPAARDIARCWCGSLVLVGEPGPLVCGEDVWHDPMIYPEDEI